MLKYGNKFLVMFLADFLTFNNVRNRSKAQRKTKYTSHGNGSIDFEHVKGKKK